MGVSSPQGSEPASVRQKQVLLTLHSVELLAQVGPKQQHGSGASPTARHALHSQQHVMHSWAQPTFGGTSTAMLAQQHPATRNLEEQQQDMLK